MKWMKNLRFARVFIFFIYLYFFQGLCWGLKRNVFLKVEKLL